MILSFRDDRTRRLYDGEPVKRLDRDLAKRARRRLELLNAAGRPEDLYFPPSNGFHALEGFNPIRYAIRVNKRWRITFLWQENNAYDVYFEDYH